MGDSGGRNVFLVRKAYEHGCKQFGLFLSCRFKLRLPGRPNAPEGDSQELIATKAYENGVLALPGTVFIPSDGITAYVRASFSVLDEERVNEALRRLGEVVRRETC